MLKYENQNRNFKKQGVSMNHRYQVVIVGMGFVLLMALAFVGRVGATLSLQSSISLTETYTDNLFFRDNDREDDFGTLFGPDLTLLFENPDIVIGATYTGRMSLYVNNSDANRYNQNANIILDLPFLTKQYRGLTVSIDETMNFTPQLDAFYFSEAENAATLQGANSALGGTGGVGRGSGIPGSGSASGGAGGIGGAGTGGVGGAGSGSLGGIGGTGGTQGIFTRRASAFYNRAGVRLGYAWSPRLNTSLGYTNQYRHFFSGGFQDSLTHTGTFSVPYRTTEFTTVTPSYSYRQTDFLGESTQNTSADRIIVHTAQLGLTHAFTSSLSASVSGGVSFVKQQGATEQVPLAGGGTQERGIDSKFERVFIGSANLTKTFQRGTLGLSAQQTIGSGGGLASQATRTRSVTGRGNYALTARMNTFASAGWAKNDSIDGNAFDTTTYRVQTGLGYSFTQWLYGNLSYSRIDQRSRGTVANDVVVNQVFLNLTAVADPWYLIR